MTITGGDAVDAARKIDFGQEVYKKLPSIRVLIFSITRRELMLTAWL